MEVDLYSRLSKSCEINKEIPIEKFFDHGSPNDSEAYLIRLYTIKVTLRYLFRVKNGDFPSIPKNSRNNEELHIVEAEIKTRSDGWYRIHSYAKAIIQCYPHSLLLVIRYKDEYCYFLSKTHYNARNINKNVTDTTRGSGWFSDENHIEFPVDPRICSPSFFEYSPTRNTVSRMINHFNIKLTIDDLLKAWFIDIEEDRSAWSYFLHWDANYYNHRILASEEKAREKNAEKMINRRTDMDRRYLHPEDAVDEEDNDEFLLEQDFIIDDGEWPDDADDLYDD